MLSNMGNIQKKRLAKLEQRIESYEDIPTQLRRAYTRPGSQNRHKQHGGGTPKMKRR